MSEYDRLKGQKDQISKRVSEKEYQTVLNALDDRVHLCERMLTHATKDDCPEGISVQNYWSARQSEAQAVRNRVRGVLGLDEPENGQAVS